MQQYNVTLIQDVADYLITIEPDVIRYMSDHHPREYLTKEHVFEWIIREEIEQLSGLSCVGHNHTMHPYRKIAHKVDRALPVALNTLTLAYIKFPQIYNDNVFIQVDLKGTDLYIQYYRHGMQSALPFLPPT